jgi:hypothetical protein
MVINRIRDTMELISAIESNKAVVAAILAERYGPELRDGETLPDWVLALELTGRDLLAALKRLIELDDQVGTSGSWARGRDTEALQLHSPKKRP